MMNESGTSRRATLRAVGAGAGLFAFGTAGTVVASGDADGSDFDVSPDCECYYQYICDTSQYCDDRTYTACCSE